MPFFCFFRSFCIIHSSPFITISLLSALSALFPPPTAHCAQSVPPCGCALRIETTTAGSRFVPHLLAHLLRSLHSSIHPPLSQSLCTLCTLCTFPSAHCPLRLIPLCPPVVALCSREMPSIGFSTAVLGFAAWYHSSAHGDYTLFGAFVVLCGIYCLLEPTISTILDSNVIWNKSISVPNHPKHDERRFNTYPSPIMNTWYHLLDSDELKAGSVREFRALNRVFVLWRDKEGNAVCQDAFCIHLGANLAVGGKVVDGCLQCPFHKVEDVGAMWLHCHVSRCAVRFSLCTVLCHPLLLHH
jgi:hypothetical protein